MKSCGPKWLKNSLWKAEGSKNLMDCNGDRRKSAFRLMSTAIATPSNVHLPVLPFHASSFHRAKHDATTASKSAQFPPYINPESAAPQSQAVPHRAETRKR